MCVNCRMSSNEPSCFRRATPLRRLAFPELWGHTVTATAVHAAVPAADVPSRNNTYTNGQRTESHEVVDSDEGMFRQLGRAIVSKIPDTHRVEPRSDVFLEIEEAIVTAVLERTKGNKQAAANLLGIYRPRLYHMLRKHNLHKSGLDLPTGRIRPTREERRSDRWPGLNVLLGTFWSLVDHGFIVLRGVFDWWRRLFARRDGRIWPSGTLAHRVFSFFF